MGLFALSASRSLLALKFLNGKILLRGCSVLSVCVQVASTFPVHGVAWVQLQAKEGAGHCW